MKVITIIGARPQFIKVAAVSHRFAQLSDIVEVILHTGQHYDSSMSDIFFNELGIPNPKYNLGIGGLSHGKMTGRQLEKIEEVLIEERPDYVLVYGDTNSTLAGALASVKLNIPLAHVEAGIRSFNRKMPEEHNRILTDHAADLLFAPTPIAFSHLRNEGIPEERIHLVGDVMFDASLIFGPIADKRSNILFNLFPSPQEYILATIHRAETTDDPNLLSRVLTALQESPIPVVLPIHPRTKKHAQKKDLEHPNLHVIDPIGYVDMVALEKSCSLIVTDSGGVQKEAYFHGKPCVTIRTETEWVELIDTGWNRLASLGSVDGIKKSIKEAIGTVGQEMELYGTGNSGEKIIETLIKNNS